MLAALACATGSASVCAQGQAVGAFDGATRSYAAQGGELRIRINHDLLRQYGATLTLAAKADAHGAVAYGLRDDELSFVEDRGAIRRFGTGALTTRAGFVLARKGKQVVVPWLALESGSTEDPPTLALRDALGRTWFVAERMMYRIDGEQSRLRMPTVDLRAGPALAAFLGHADAAGWVFGDMALDSALVLQGGAAPKSCAAPVWHGTNGRITDVRLVSIPVVQQMRCRRSTDRVQPFDVCDGPGGADDGEVVFAPSALLRNSDTDLTADVPWYEKFMAGTPAPPYNNDQHPILVWNLYRVGADGRVRQVGRSGAKHAWFSANVGCNDPTCGPFGGNVLGRACADEYTAGSNDLEYYLAPRSEIVPARGWWGRCGSTWDRLGPGGAAGCDGVHDPFNGTPPAQQGYYERLVARESDLERPANDGARWFFEAWYVVRDDIDIFNTMGRIEVEPLWSGFQWTLAARSAFATGPAIDAWVAPGAGAQQRSDTLATPEGTLRVAVRVTPQGSRWRYDYAVMNLDFARALTDGAEPNLRVLDARGIGAVSVPLLPGAGASGLQAFDADPDPANDWTTQASTSAVVFSAPAGTNTLDWGTLHAFSFESSAPPQAGNLTLQPARSGSPATYAVPTLVPGVPPLFADGLE